MTKRLRLVGGIALSLLPLAPSLGHTQAPRPISVEFYNAPLRQVIRAFAAFSGNTIVVASDAGDPDVSATLTSVDWRVGLDSILETHALVARSDVSGVIRIERQRTVTVEFQNALLSHVIRGFATYSGSRIVVASDVGDPVVSGSINNRDWRLGLDRILEAHSLVARLDVSGIVRIERRIPPAIRPPGRLGGES